jgi:protein tyrosine/serine phosphatase
MSLLIPPINFGMVDDDIYRSGEPIDLNFPFLESLQLRTLLVLSSSPPSAALVAFVNDQNFSADSSDADSDHHSSNGFFPFAASALLSSPLLRLQRPVQSPTPLRLLHMPPSASSITHSAAAAASSASASSPPSASSASSASASGASGAPLSLSEETVISALSLLLTPSALPILVSCSSGHWLTGTVIGCWRKVCGWSLSSISAEYRRFGIGGDEVGRGGSMNEQFIELFDTELVQGGRRERERRRNRGAAATPAAQPMTGRRGAGSSNSDSSQPQAVHASSAASVGP